MIAYYYCSFSTFCSMLNSKSLWLTDLTKTNDSQEVLRLYDNIWEELKKRFTDSDLDQEVVTFTIQQFEYAKTPQLHFDVPFGCCMSYMNDLVQQWNEYGDKGRGVSVGFELDWFNVKRQLPITSINTSTSIGYEAVQYDSRQLRNQFFELFYNAIREQGRNAWVLTILPTFKHYAGFIKNPSFRDEREIRILFYPSNQEDSLDGLSGLKEDVRPHYCLDWANSTSTALRSVTLGYDCQHTLEEVAQLIRQQGLTITESVRVYKSDCSYRNRIN